MKNIIQHINYFCFALALLMMLISGCSCSTQKFGPPTPDPLVSFHWSSLNNLDSNKAIKDDFERYIQSLSPDEKNGRGPIQFFEDGTGQHAIYTEIALNGIDWAHVLIYDKDNKRIKVIKYASGRYAS